MKKLLAMVLVCLVSLVNCKSSEVEGPQPSPSGDYTAFVNPELVPILGYTADIMEPFFSRDGRFMFFNSMGTIDKDIYYATYDTQSDIFTFADTLNVLNSPAVEGVPTLDNNNRLYYISTFNYPPANANIFETIYTGEFNPANPLLVTNLVVVPNLADNIFGHLIFDVEVSPDGRTLYFVDGVFSGGGFPDKAVFAYAIDHDNGFVRQPDSDVIFAEINTSDLEYAACIAQDGLEFFFTRFEFATGGTRIWRATRLRETDPFGTPRRLAAIEGFVEAPALSPDERQLYYHRLNPETNIFELYRVTRP